MVSLNPLHNRKNSPETHSQLPQTDKTALLAQALVLEPILTPSGLPIDIGTEADVIEADDSGLGGDRPFVDVDPVTDVAFEPVENDAPDAGRLDASADFDADFLPYDFLGTEAIGFESGLFIVGETGEVTIDYLFDGGGYKGELALFSLDGMELPGTDDFVQADFMQEAASRALSDSELGHVAISDRTEGARFSGQMPGESRDLNGGDYLGAKTFQMRPGDEIGFMLVPNGRVQEVLDNPAIGGAKTPLFSLDTANPDGMFHTGQIADVTGDGNTFVFEDLRVDGQSDLDYNDLIFQVRGAEARNVMRVEDVTGAPPAWMETDLGEAIIAHALPDLPPVDYSFDVADQPLVGVIDTGLNGNNPDLDYSRILLGQDWVETDDNPLLEVGGTDEHGTQTLGLIGATQDNDLGIDGINDDAPLWVGRAIGSGQWSDSLVEFVDAAKDSGQPNAVANLSFDLTQVDAEGNVTTRYELTPQEQSAIEYARQNGVLIVAAAGNDGGVMSALGQASQLFDNIISVGAANGLERADLSSYGYGLDLLAEGFAIAPTGETVDFAEGTSVATARVTGAVSQVWAANPDLSYRQVIELLKATAQDVEAPGWDPESGFGLLNMAAAVQLAKVTSGQTYDTPAITPTDTWSGEGLVTPLERAAGINLALIPSPWKPGASPHIQTLVNAFASQGITDPKVLAYAAATIGYESSWNPSAVNTTDAAAQTGYPGAGLAQITWRNNYQAVSNATGIDFVGNPSYMLDPEKALKAKAAFYKLNNMISYIERGDYQSAAGIYNAGRATYRSKYTAKVAAAVSTWLGVFNNAGNTPTTNPGVPSSQRRPYQIRRGDTLWAIAQRELGKGNRWREITKNAAGSQAFTDAEARRLQIGQVVYLPVKQQVGTGRPIVTPPVYTPPRGAIGKNSRAPYLFEQAYARIRGAQNDVRPTGDAERVGNGWVQKFKNSQGHESWLMLEDGAKTAFWVFGSNLAEYKFMGGPVGRTLDGRSVFLGYPRSDENVFTKNGKRAVWQAFAAGNGTARIHNYGAASVATWGVIGSLYTNMVGAYSFLGMPTRREYMDGDTTWADFQGGKIAYHWPTGKVEALRNGQLPSWRRPSITYVNFSGRVGPAIGVNLRYSPRHEDRSNRNEPHNKTLQFDAWTTGETVTDLWLGTPDSRWFRVAGTSLWVPSAYIWGNPPNGGGGSGGSTPSKPPILTRQGAQYFASRSQFYTTGNIFAQSMYGSRLVGGRGYTEGNCTWYAHGRLLELGKRPAALRSMNGDARRWHTQMSNGSQIVSPPRVGDLAQWTANGANHIAVVEALHSDGTITISESHWKTVMNGPTKIGYGKGTLHNVRIISAGNPTRYIRVPNV